MVLSQGLLLGDHGFGYPVPDHLLRIVRVHRIFRNESARRSDAIQHVPECVLADLLRRAVGGTGRGRGDERAERRILGARHVRAVPPVFWILRQFRRHSSLPQMDHVLELHQVRIRGDRLGDVLLRPGETQVFPGLLPLQKSGIHFGGTGYARCRLYPRHSCPLPDICRSQNRGVHVPPFQTSTLSVDYWTLADDPRNTIRPTTTIYSVRNTVHRLPHLCTLKALIGDVLFLRLFRVGAHRCLDPYTERVP